MDKEGLLLKLNWFYTLELSQVDLYNSQSKAFSNSYIGLVFERIAYIEQQHVDNIAAKIKKMGGTPTKLGDVISPIVGSVFGKLFAISGLENVLKINILIEQKAMQDYKNLIQVLKSGHRDDELIKTLQFNLLDENFHTIWFEDKLKILPKKN